MLKTDMLINPIDKLIGKVCFGRIELSCLLVLLILELVQGYVLLGLFYHTWLSLFGVLFLVMGDSLIYILNILFFAMLFRIVLNWMNQDSTAALREVIQALTDPVLRYSRDLIPVMGGFDMAPVFWMVVFKVISFVIYASLSMSLY